MKKINFKKLIRSAKNRKQRRTVIFFLVKLGMARDSVSDKVTKAKHIVELMTGNANFATPSPTLASITTLTNALHDAEAALDGRKIKTEQRDIALEAFTQAMNDLQAYVQNVCGSDTEMILSSGFEVRNPRTKPVKLSAPEGLTADNTEISGEVELSWTPVKGSKSYAVQYSNDLMMNNWQYAALSTKASATISDLNPGLSYAFRVLASNAAGQSGWSEPALCRPN